MKKHPWLWLIASFCASFCALMGFVCLTVVGIYFFITSKAGIDFLISKTKQRLETSQIHLSYKTLATPKPSEWLIQKLTLSTKAWKLALDSMHLQSEISFFPLQIRIHTAEIQNLQFQFDHPEKYNIHLRDTQATLKADLRISFHGWRWLVDVNRTALGLQAQKFIFSQKDSQTQFEISNLTEDATLQGSFQTQGLFDFQPQALETFQLKALTQSGPSSTTVTQNRQTKSFTFESLHSNAQGELSAVVDKNINLTHEIVFERLYSKAFLKNSLTLRSQKTFQVSPDFKQVSLQANAQIQSAPPSEMIRFKSSCQTTPLEIQCQGQMHLTLEPRLSSLIKNTELLKPAGTLRAQIDFHKKIPAPPQKSWNNFLALTLDQIHTTSPEVDLKILSLTPQYPFSSTSHLKFEFPKNKIELQSFLYHHADDVLKLTGTLQKNNERFEISTAFETSTYKILKPFFKSKFIDEFGQWFIHGHFQTSFLPQPTPQLSSSGSLEISQKTLPSHPHSALLLPEPLHLTPRITLEKDQLNVDIRSSLPTLEIRNKGKIQNTQSHFQLQSPQLSLGRDFDFSLELSQGAVLLNPALTQQKMDLQGLQITLGGRIRNKDLFYLDALNAKLNQNTLELNAEATGGLQKKDFQTLGTFSLQIPEGFPPLEGHRLSGKVEIPWTLSISRGKNLLLEASAEFKNLCWSKNQFRVQNISGKIPIQEKLTFDGKQIHFSYLIHQNPFERVDYERLRPLLNDASQLRIESVGYEEKNYGPIQGFYSMNQNLLYAHRTDAVLGRSENSSGKLYGEMFLNLIPSNFQIGILSRLTELNLIEVLPKKYLQRTPLGDQEISARTALVLYPNRGTIEGRVDVTKIGGSQLITLVNLLDPSFENTRMNLLRTALGIGYPTYAEFLFQKGHMDMGADISALGVKQHFDIRGIPISTLITSSTADFIQKTTKGSPP